MTFDQPLVAVKKKKHKMDINKKKLSAIGFPVIPQPYKNKSGLEDTPGFD